VTCSATLGPPAVSRSPTLSRLDGLTIGTKVTIRTIREKGSMQLKRSHVPERGVSNDQAHTALSHDGDRSDRRCDSFPRARLAGHRDPDHLGSWRRGRSVGVASATADTAAGTRDRLDPATNSWLDPVLRPAPGQRPRGRGRLY